MCIKDLSPKNLLVLKDITGVCPLIIAINRGILNVPCMNKSLPEQFLSAINPGPSQNPHGQTALIIA
ncbi:MAG: hypothetical protein ACLFQK_04375 [Fibrobacterota bacterium]